MTEMEPKIIKDFLTGRELPLVGPEVNRQLVEKFLVEKKGFRPEDVEVGPMIEVTVAGEVYRSRLDLVVSVCEKRVMVIRCVAGSPGSWERGTLSSARIFQEGYQIPYSVVSDGKEAVILDTASGKRLGNTLSEIPSREEIESRFSDILFQPYPEKRLEREKVVFRSFDMDYVNVVRNGA